jgi:hypothetical protein
MIRGEEWGKVQTNLGASWRFKHHAQLSIVAPAPIVDQHAAAFRGLFSGACVYENFRTSVIELIVLDNKCLSNISRCTLKSANQTNILRFECRPVVLIDR